MIASTYVKLLADLERELTEAERDLERFIARIDHQREYIETLQQGIDGLKSELQNYEIENYGG